MATPLGKRRHPAVTRRPGHGRTVARVSTVTARARPAVTCLQRRCGAAANDGGDDGPARPRKLHCGGFDFALVLQISEQKRLAGEIAATTGVGISWFVAGVGSQRRCSRVVAGLGTTSGEDYSTTRQQFGAATAGAAMATEPLPSGTHSLRSRQRRGTARGWRRWLGVPPFSSYPALAPPQIWASSLLVLSPLRPDPSLHRPDLTTSGSLAGNLPRSLSVGGRPSSRPESSLARSSIPPPKSLSGKTSELARAPWPSPPTPYL